MEDQTEKGYGCFSRHSWVGVWVELGHGRDVEWGCDCGLVHGGRSVREHHDAGRGEGVARWELLLPGRSLHGPRHLRAIPFPEIEPESLQQKGRAFAGYPSIVYF
ncbi:hypothetical protein Fmac_025337 [Flemingia macrophylla]|uniref:Uncharacterized protein n=1 Tax=Flemingia macrophylla TaxID=520843 RepID=A0ABD1LRZ3_9FABA